jgi:hypothetical protein
MSRKKMHEEPKRVYAWRDGSGKRFGKFDAQPAGEEVEKLQKLHGHELEPADVVEAAADEKNVLHDLFEWDNLKAGHEWRLQQARFLLQSLKVTITHYDGKTITLDRATAVLPAKNGSGGKKYVMMERAMRDADSRNYLLRVALLEAIAFRNKYKELSELTKIFVEIDLAYKEHAGELKQCVM